MVFLFSLAAVDCLIEKRSKNNQPTPKQTLLLKHVFLLYIVEGRIALICAALKVLKVAFKRAQHVQTANCNIGTRE